MNTYKRLWCLAALLALAAVACAPATGRKPVEQPMPEKDQAQSFIERGDYRGAARIYQQRASGELPPRRDLLLARAVDALQKAGAQSEAHSVAETIDPEQLEPHQRASLYLFWRNATWIWMTARAR